MSELRKSEDDSMLFGVCGGLAEWSGIDSTIIRLLFAFFAVAGIGTPILIYIILALVMKD